MNIFLLWLIAPIWCPIMGVAYVISVCVSAWRTGYEAGR